MHGDLKKALIEFARNAECYDQHDPDSEYAVASDAGYRSAGEDLMALLREHGLDPDEHDRGDANDFRTAGRFEVQAGRGANWPTRKDGLLEVAECESGGRVQELRLGIEGPVYRRDWVSGCWTPWVTVIPRRAA